ncbi:c-type cytochrome [soil metagenome]
MKSLVTIFDRRALSLAASVAAVAASMSVSLPAFANPELAKSKNCMACHTVDKRLVGPGFKEIAVKYAGDKDAVDKLSVKVIKGGAGVWGPVPMPANTQVSEAEAKTLTNWILTLK